jgi:bifunctional non-homologous end joining protein LigD
MADRSLDTYRRKRNPSRTPEPFGNESNPARAAGEMHQFVVQQHAARRMHWDFRLEIDGVLSSWAVPRGPSIDPKEKRLAVQTEDHPLEYADFEGLIPAGNYGAGPVIIWDQGMYRSVDGVAPAEGLRRGKLDFELQGHKLRGRWALVRTKGGSGRDWLLIKKADGTSASAAEPVAAQPQSVLSGLTVEELARGVSLTQKLAEQAKGHEAVRRAVEVGKLTPMLAHTAERAFSRTGWIFELKHDGIRVLGAREPGGSVRLRTRNQREVGASFPEIARSLSRLPCDALVLDGEIVTLDERGASSFERLQRRMGQTDSVAVARATVELPAILYCFDLLAVAGFDLRSLPLLARKDLLRQLVPRTGVLRYSDHIEEAGEAFFKLANEQGLEGIVAKRADSPYAAGRRSRDWLKIKALRSADLAIVGLVPGKGSRKDLGSLMLAWRDGDGFRYAGNVGSGLDEGTIAKLRSDLLAARRESPAFGEVLEKPPRGSVFVEPEMVAEVRYTEVTEAGLLRQPVFVRLREDKRSEHCDHRPERRPAAEPITPVPTAPSRPKLQLSNLGKVFWPADGYTKGDLLAYYERIWPCLQPYLRDRPVVLTRYPDGIEGKNFFQKNAPDFIPDWVLTHRIEDTDYFVCNDLDTLLYVINSGCIPLHVWSARRSSVERPDWAIIDLDPKGAPFAHVAALAKELHRLLEPLGVTHFLKTSGQDGLHVLVPLGATLTHDEAKTLAEVLARLLTAERPDIATVARPLGDRGGKVYVDFLQNGFGKTIAGPFSVRPRPGAPVSTPLEWRELTRRLDPSRFTIETVPKRFEKRADPMREVLTARVDVKALLGSLEARVR